jgi:glycosyltransferase involved in cell wall biosynthesis
VILILFTASYPFDAATEQTFLKDEIEQLAANFTRVILVPRRCQGTRLPLPANVEVAEDYFACLESASKLLSVIPVLTSPFFYRDLFQRPWLLFHPPSFARLVAFLGGAYLTRGWVERWLDKNQVEARKCIFYTYWFDQAAMGIGLLKRSHPDLRLVSRAHGYDLYEETFRPPYWPARPAALALVDGIFADAEAGANYLRNRYPVFASKIEAGLLGVKDPGFLASRSTDGVFRLASCSIIRPIKRVDLLLEGILHAARMRPGQKFEWHHHGNGETPETRLALQQRAEAEFPPNACAFFPGYSSHQALMDFYRENPVDLFMNTSRSEGTPVSTMEAISCGIPVAATAVGGNKEIVMDKNGILLSPDPSPQEIAEAIFKLMDDPEMARAQRQGSRAVWDEKYNADKNFDAFVQRLRMVREKESHL